MPITTTELEFRQSGTTNLGGAISATSVSSSLNTLFDYVAGAEAVAGDTEYRCVYLRNSHATLTLYSAIVWISANTPAPGSAVQIGLGTSGVNGTEQVIASENTAPIGVTFFDAATEAAALAIGDIPAGQHMAVWIKRTITPGAAAYNADSMTLSFGGDSGA